MFLTRFTRVDKNIEDYQYRTREEAQYHLGLFKNDDSGLYRNISVLNAEKNQVLCILPFQNGIPQEPVFEGSWVKLNPEYATEGELKYVFVVTNMNESTEHINIMCMNTNMVLKPIETVELKMIHVVPSM